MFKYLESFSTNRLTSPTRLFLAVVAPPAYSGLSSVFSTVSSSRG